MLPRMPLTPAELAALEEPRQAALLAAITPLVRPFAGGVMGFHEPGSWQNQACGVGLDGPVSDAEIDAFVEFYASRGVEPRVELSPFADETLIAGLAARSFVVREFENVLARELPAGEELEAALPFGRPAGLELTSVDRSDDEAIERAAEMTLRGFYPEGEVPPPMLAACRQTLLLDSVRSYAATVDGELVAVGSVALGERVASLMGVSTLPAFRRRGIQQALMVTRLATAREHGCVLATIGSRPGIPTERNAMRVGFCMAYTKVILVRPGEGLATSV
jgi:GNAT superfamily N-acetyltransferase